MTTRPAPIASVRLARSLPRLLVMPLLLLLAAGAAIAAGLLAVAPPAGIAIVAVGSLVGLVGLALMVVLISVRLRVEESAVRVSWIGGRRIYALSPGPVTRVRLRGSNASRLRVRSGAFGWGLGRAVLRGEEPIHIVRLAPTATAILVPTDRGRLAIAPASDDELLDALSRAARARHRHEQEIAAVAATPEPAETAAAAPVEPPAVEPPAVEPPRPMTGIERAMLEQRMAAEREAAEREAAEPAAAQQTAEPVAATGAAEPVVVEPAPAPSRRPRVDLGHPGARAAFVLLPMLGTGIAWFAGVATGRMPESGSDLARLISLALVMAGPATSVGAVMALAWWPRLLGVVVTGGLVASVFIGRALVAP
jgi:hypothetical protein